MIHVYGDDGADAKKERVVAVAVIAGTEEWWQNVEDQWIVRFAAFRSTPPTAKVITGTIRTSPRKKTRRCIATLPASSRAACSAGSESPSIWRRKNRSFQRRNADGCCENPRRRHRGALVRYAGRTSASLTSGLEKLSNLGLHVD